MPLRGHCRPEVTSAQAAAAPSCFPQTVVPPLGGWSGHRTPAGKPAPGSSPPEARGRVCSLKPWAAGVSDHPAPFLDQRWDVVLFLLRGSRVGLNGHETR